MSCQPLLITLKMSEFSLLHVEKKQFKHLLVGHSMLVVCSGIERFLR